MTALLDAAIRSAHSIDANLVDANSLSAWSGPRVVFALIALLVLGGAVLTITRKNSVAAVMSLVATFFGLAATYALLYAHFLAALQVLVYAGAIMVLFIFVVMVLNRDEQEPFGERNMLLKVIFGTTATIYVVVKVGFVFLRDVVPAYTDPPPDSFGTVETVGNILFTDYLFAFEAVSVLLLIAVIAAVVVARAHKQNDEESDGPSEPETKGMHG